MGNVRYRGGETMNCEICDSSGRIELSLVRPEKHLAIRGIARCICSAGAPFVKFATVDTVVREWLSFQEDHLDYLSGLEGYHYNDEARCFNRMRGLAMMLGYVELLEPEVALEETKPKTFKRKRKGK
jgi:hypothetical protein